MIFCSLLSKRKLICSFALFGVLIASQQFCAAERPWVIIPVQTDNSTMVMSVSPSGGVNQIYYGQHLSEPKGALRIGRKRDVRFSQSDIYPSFGDGSMGEVALQATFSNGDPATDLQYVDHQQESIEKGVTETRIRLKDGAYDLWVTLVYRAYEREDVIVTHAIVKNECGEEIELNSFASGTLEVSSSEYWLTHFYGNWASEMMLTEERIDRGIKVIDSKTGVRATQFANPSFLLSLDGPATEACGSVIGGALMWSGNYRFSFEISPANELKIIAGMNPFVSEFCLPVGETFETPGFAFTYSANGKGEVSRNLHRWSRTHLLAEPSMIRPVVLNSWEGARCDFDEESIKKMIRGSADLGVEIFVLDDGWFGSKHPRNDAARGLGDWHVNLKKLPGGLAPLIDCAEENGIKFGIWMEPEMVNPKSELAEAHPEWIIQRLNRKLILSRNQLILDLSNPEVQDFVYDAVDKILSENSRIAYLKWDSNRHLQNFGSQYLSGPKQTHLWIEYVHGLYSVFDRLRKSHPNVILQDCSSGGGRVDFGALKYFHEFWASDNTDPGHRLLIQWGTSHIYPAMASASHVTNSPNHHTKAVTPMKFRVDVAMSGRFGIELSPSALNKTDRKQLAQGVSEYKRIRKTVQEGNLYRLRSPYKGDDCLLMYVSEDKSHAVVFYYLLNYRMQNENPLLHLEGLLDDKAYHVREINNSSNKAAISFDEASVMGESLMHAGFRPRLHRQYKSMVLELTLEE